MCENGCAWLAMRRVGDIRRLQSVQRVGPDLPETVLNLDKSSSTFALNMRRVGDLQILEGENKRGDFDETREGEAPAAESSST